MVGDPVTEESFKSTSVILLLSFYYLTILLVLTVLFLIGILLLSSNLITPSLSQSLSINTKSKVPTGNLFLNSL